MARVKKVLIVGGGIGGLCSAIALRRAGIEVDLVEINKDFTVYHVGIVVQGNAVRAMLQLGIVDECIAAGYPYSGLTFQDLHGKVLTEIPGIPLAGPGYPSDLGLTRPALHKVLIDAARRAGASLRLGTTFTRIAQSPDKVSVTLSDGTSGEYDLVVGADGVNSKVRATIFGEHLKPKFTGQGVWRYNLPRPKEITRAFMCMGLPHGKPGFIPLTEETGYVLMVRAEPGNPKHPPEQLAEIFRAGLATCTGMLARLRDQITDSKLVVYRPLYAIFVPAPWHKGRVLLLGDSAHATTPHMGQGAAQAMEDAVVLGELMAKDAPIDELLQAFMQRRYERCKFIYESSLQIGEWEQHPTPDADPPGLTKKMIQVMAQPI